MRRLFLALVVLAFALNECNAQEKPDLLISEGLQPYVYNYMEAMTADGWSMKHLLDNDVFIIFDYEIGKDFEERGIVGLALGMDNDELVYVIINVTAWVSLTEYEKQDVVNHELMHDIFNIRHTDKLDKSKLMHPSSYPNSWGETTSRLIDAINDLNNVNGY